MAEEVKLRITIEDNGTKQVKDVTVSAEDLKNAVREVHEEVDKLNPAMINFASIAQGIDAVTAVFDQLSGAVAELTSYSQAQVEVETKLQTAMRNTMAATDEEMLGKVRMKKTKRRQKWTGRVRTSCLRGG